MSTLIASDKSVQVFDFHGGIHPAENKAQSTQQPITQLPIKAGSEYVIPLNQHIGAPSKIIVEVGQTVLAGQMIAEAHQFVSAATHAPTSGTITAIEKRPVPHSSQLSSPCVVIKADGKDQWVELAEHNNVLTENKQILLERIRNAGIAGMGGAGFPTSVKLNVGDNKIDTLIINAAECEPYITSDDMLMRERSDKIVKGIQVLQYLTDATECLIGIEDNKPEAIEALKTAITEQLTTEQQNNIAVAVVPTKYPSGGEKQLIKLLTNKEVPAGKIPANIGVVCQNIASTVAVYEAVTFEKPLVSRITTVTGYAVSQPQNLEVRIGTSIEQLLEFTGFKPSKNRQRLIMGGPMMGFTLPSAELPVIKTTNCILAPSSKEVPHNDMANPCIRCGMCTEACPAELLPQQLYWFAKGSELEKAEQHNIFDCIECGACSYVCPSQIPLVQYYRFAKGAIKEDRAAKEKAERARMRHEAREARIEREKVKKEAKRKARAEQAAKAQAAKKAGGTTGKPAPLSPKGSVPTKSAPTKAAPAGAAAGMSDLEKLQKQLKAAQTAVEKSKEKLEQAKAEGSDKVSIYESAIEKSQEKIKTLAKDIAAAKKAEKAAKEAGIDPDKGDPNSPERLKKKWEMAQGRLDTAKQRLEQAETEGSDKVEALRTGLEKQQTRVDEAKAAYEASLKTDSETKKTDKPAVDSEKSEAPSKTEALSKIGALSKLEAKLRAQQERLNKAQQNLDLAKEQNLPTVEALTKGVAKQQDKLTALQEELKVLQNESLKESAKGEQ